MKILIATGIFLPEVGGPATYAFRFCKELVLQGHDVLIVSYSDKKNYSFDDSLPCRVVRVPRKNIFSNYFRYFKAIFKNAEGFDIVYAFDYFSAGIPALLATKLRGKKLAIRNGGDLIWERYLEKSEKSVTMKGFYERKLHRKSFFKYAVSKIILRLADSLVFTTKLQSDIFCKYYKIDKNKIEHIYNPFPFEISQKFKNYNESRNNEIIWAGRMVNKNNLKKLVNVFCALSKKDYNLVLIGEGVLKPELLKIVKDKKCKNIFIEDKMSNDRLIERIANSHAVVFPAYTDISPILLLETLAVGTPFILTREHGFDWLRGKTVEFDPLSSKDLNWAFTKITNKDFCKLYKEKLVQIKYDYTFSEAVKDTVKLFKKLILFKDK